MGDAEDFWAEELWVFTVVDGVEGFVEVEECGAELADGGHLEDIAVFEEFRGGGTKGDTVSDCFLDRAEGFELDLVSFNGACVNDFWVVGICCDALN